MMMYDLVSIIIPTFNAEDTIIDAIDSVLNQTYEQVEVIVVDDGSSDGTLDVLRQEYGTNDKVFIRSENHAGVSHARNVGIQLARGKWIGFCDSDDSLAADAIEMLLMCREESEIIAGAMSFDSEQGAAVIKAIDRTIVVKRENLCIEFEGLWDRNYVQSACSKLFSGEFINSNCLRFDEQLSSYEDLDFVLRCLAKCTSLSATRNLCYHYRVKPSGTSTTTRYKDDTTRQMEIVAARVKSFYDISLKGISMMTCYGRLIQFLIVAVNNAAKSKKSFRERAQDIAWVFSRPIFLEAVSNKVSYPNVYSSLVCHFGAVGCFRIILIFVLIRNFIRSHRAAK